MKTEREPEDWKEGRRLRAWNLVQEGWKQKDIAKALAVSKGAVSQWVKRAKVEGRDGLRRHPAAGPQPRLSVEQVKHLPALLDTRTQSSGGGLESAQAAGTSRISAVETSHKWLLNFGGPKNVCGIGRPCCNNVFLMQGVLFSYPCRDQ